MQFQNGCTTPTLTFSSLGIFSLTFQTNNYLWHGKNACTPYSQPTQVGMFFFKSITQSGLKYFSHLQKILILLANQERVFQTLSRNIFFLKPARAEILLTPSKNIKFFWPIRREFFIPSQGIFYSSSQPEQSTFDTFRKY